MLWKGEAVSLKVYYGISDSVGLLFKETDGHRNLYPGGLKKESEILPDVI